MTHEHQAWVILKRARMLSKSSGTLRSSSPLFRDKGKDITQSGGSPEVPRVGLPGRDDRHILNIRTKASVHQAVLRLLSKSACCSAHAALITDVSTFYRTYFADTMNAVQLERKSLRKSAETLVATASAKVQRMEKLLIRHTRLAHSVIERASRREKMLHMQRAFKGWRCLVDREKIIRRQAALAYNCLQVSAAPRSSGRPDGAVCDVGKVLRCPEENQTG